MCVRAHRTVGEFVPPTLLARRAKYCVLMLPRFVYLESLRLLGIRCIPRRRARAMIRVVPPALVRKWGVFGQNGSDEILSGGFLVRVRPAIAAQLVDPRNEVCSEMPNEHDPNTIRTRSDCCVVATVASQECSYLVFPRQLLSVVQEAGVQHKAKQ